MITVNVSIIYLIKAFSSEKIFYYIGEDFDFLSDERFEDLEATVKFFADRPCKGFDIIVNTPSEYFKWEIEQKKVKNTSWPIKTTDFMPYRDIDNFYWVG